MNALRRLALLSGLVLPVLLAACGDDEDPLVGPEPEFTVELRVTDPAGNPVPGLELGLCPDLPLYQDGQNGAQAGKVDPSLWWDRLATATPSPFYPFTTIRFELEQPAWTRLEILDIEGGLVRELVALDYPAGSQAVMWDGRDEQGQAVPSGVYHAHLVLWDTPGEDPRFEQSRPMLLAAFYADQVLVATGDDAGVIELTDRRLFPYLYELEPFPATDENGEQVGDIVFTPAIRFYLTDPHTGGVMRFDADVTGPVVLDFTWDPAN
jgi:hypothetical protein